MCGVGAVALVVRSRARVWRLDRVDRVLRLPTLGWWLGAGLVAVAVNSVPLIWELAQMDFLTIREW